MSLIFISTSQHKLDYNKIFQQVETVYVFSSDYFADRCYGEFEPSKEYIIRVNRIRLKDGALCDKVPKHMTICCYFEPLEGLVDGFDDGCGF